MPAADSKSPANSDTLAASSNVAPKVLAEPRRQQKFRGWTTLVVLAVILGLGGAGGWYWWQQHPHALPAYIAQANGRLEAEQIEISTKYPGRIAAVLAKEGDLVKAGTVVARMDTVELEAQLQSAQASVDKSRHEKVMTEAIIAERDSERIFAAQELQRTTALSAKGWAPVEQLDQRRSLMKVAQAAYETAVAAQNAAQAQIVAGQAEVARLQSQMDDSTLVATATGRIQYKLAQPGEVLASGGRVLTLLDLTNVYMTVFVPAAVAGRLTLGDEARMTLDPLPGFVVPANVTFVATEAQFTPKAVETADEREKLMFRVKLTIDPTLLTRYQEQAKTGIRGIGFVRTDPHGTWPDRLAVRLP